VKLHAVKIKRISKKSHFLPMLRLGYTTHPSADPKISTIRIHLRYRPKLYITPKSKFQELKNALLDKKKKTKA